MACLSLILLIFHSEGYEAIHVFLSKVNFKSINILIGVEFEPFNFMLLDPRKRLIQPRLLIQFSAEVYTGPPLTSKR